MRTSLALVAFTTIGAVASVAHAQDAPPPPPPAQAGPPPGAMPPPPPPADMPRGGEEERDANNAVYLEGLGPGLFYSINYDRAFGDFSARVGFGYLSVGASAGNGVSGVSESATFISVPITVSYLGIGSKKHIFEMGAGAAVWSMGEGFSTFGVGGGTSGGGSLTVVVPTAIIGYRLQPPGGGFLLRAGLSPWFFKAGDVSVFLPMPHVALGGTF